MGGDFYKIVGKFVSNGYTMLVVKMGNAACIMREADFNKIIETERKYSQHKRRNNNTA